MAVRVKIPTPLRGLTGEVDTVQLECATLEEMVGQLEGAYPGMRERLCDENEGTYFIAMEYINGEDVRFLDGLASALNAGDEVSIVPAVAGG